MPDGITTWYQSRMFKAALLVVVPRIWEITGLSAKNGNNRLKSKYPIFTCYIYRTMCPPALEPVTLFTFIPLMQYAYRSMSDIGCQLEPTNTMVGANDILGSSKVSPAYILLGLGHTQIWLKTCYVCIHVQIISSRLWDKYMCQSTHWNQNIENFKDENLF